MEQYGGQLPDDPALLQKLPGIGPYTAGAIASISFGKRVPAVVGNVLRVASRLLLDEGDVTTPAVRTRLTQAVQAMQPDRPGDYNQALMELGALVCVPGGPPRATRVLWPGCAGPDGGLCAAAARKAQGQTPARGGLHRGAGHGTRKLCQRPAKGLLAGLAAGDAGGKPGRSRRVRRAKSNGSRAREPQPLPNAKHVFAPGWHMTGYRCLWRPARPRGVRVGAKRTSWRAFTPCPARSGSTGRAEKSACNPFAKQV